MPQLYGREYSLCKRRARDIAKFEQKKAFFISETHNWEDFSLSVFVSSAPYKLCQKLAEAVAASGQEYVAPPDMMGLLPGRNANRASYLTKLVEDGILKQRGLPPHAMYSFVVPIKEIKKKDRRAFGQKKKTVWERSPEKNPMDRKERPELKTRLEKTRAGFKRKPHFNLVNEFMNEVNKKSIDINWGRNEALKKRIVQLKEELYTCADGSSEEHVIIKQLVTASEERRNINTSAVAEAIEAVGHEERYAAFDFSFFSTDTEDDQA